MMYGRYELMSGFDSIVRGQLNSSDRLRTG